MIRLQHYEDRDLKPILGRTVDVRKANGARLFCERLSLKASNGSVYYSIGQIMFDVDAVLALHFGLIPVLVIL